MELKDRIENILYEIETIRTHGLIKYQEKKELLKVLDALTWFDNFSKRIMDRRYELQEQYLKDICRPAELEEIRELEAKGHTLQEALREVGK